MGCESETLPEDTCVCVLNIVVTFVCRQELEFASWNMQSELTFVPFLFFCWIIEDEIAVEVGDNFRLLVQSKYKGLFSCNLGIHYNQRRLWLVPADEARGRFRNREEALIVGVYLLQGFNKSRHFTPSLSHEVQRCMTRICSKPLRKLFSRWDPNCLFLYFCMVLCT